MTAYHHPLAALLLLFGASGALAGDSINQSSPADPAGVVTIDNTRGNVRVEGWDKAEVKVSGELDDLATGLEFAREGKLTRIAVKLPETNVASGDGSELEIRVPAGSRVEFRGVSSDVEVEGVAGGVVIDTVSGDQTLARIRGALNLKTVSGDILASEADGELALKSVSGDVNATLASRRATLSTVSGDTHLELGRFDELVAATVSGDLTISGRLQGGGRIELKTVSGDCLLGLTGPVDARATVKTGPGGEISNTLDGTAPTEEFPAMQSLSTTLGDGTGSIAVTTVSGDIVLDKH